MPGIDGVRGGVKAGDIRLSGIPGVDGRDLSRSDHSRLCKNCEEARGTGEMIGEACEGRSEAECVGSGIAYGMVCDGRMPVYAWVFEATADRRSHAAGSQNIDRPTAVSHEICSI